MVGGEEKWGLRAEEERINGEVLDQKEVDQSTERRAGKEEAKKTDSIWTWDPEAEITKREEISSLKATRIMPYNALRKYGLKAQRLWCWEKIQEKCSLQHLSPLKVVSFTQESPLIKKREAIWGQPGIQQIWASVPPL